MSILPRGLYEQLITEGLDEALAALDPKYPVQRDGLHPEEAADRIAFHLAALVRRCVAALDSGQRTELGVRLAREITQILVKEGKGVDRTDLASQEGKVLRAIASLRPDGEVEAFPLPATPLLDTTLLTNAPGEPHIRFQLNSEVASADRIDVLMAFVRQTGIRPMLDLLRRHTDAGHPLRLLTTTYTNSTELTALQALHNLGMV